MSTSLLRVNPWNFAHVFNVLRPSLLRFCFFPPGTWVFVCFWDIWVLRDPIFSAEKKQNRKRLGRSTLNTCAKFQGLALKNGVDISTFVRLSAKTTAWHRNYLVLVYIRFWALNLTLNWSYSVSSSNFCAKLCTHMPWSIRKHLVQKKNGSFFF